MEKKQGYKPIDIVLLIISIFFSIFFNSYSPLLKYILGVMILFISSILIYKSRNNKLFLIMFSIILYCNLTITVSDCFSNGTLTLPNNTLSWQIYRNTIYEIKFLCCILLFLSTINVFLNFKNSSKQNNLNNIIYNKNNIIVYSFGLIILLYGLFTGYSNVSTLNGYVSNTSTLYEYCILFFLLTWYYAGKSKIRHGLLNIYAITYIIQAVFYGDRSSAFPLIILIVILYFKNISLSKVIVFAFVGIIFSNIISVYRLNYNFTNFLDNYLLRYSIGSILSDTVSQAYYSGVAITASKYIIGNTLYTFKDFMIGIIIGGSFGASHLTKYTAKYAMNKGGSMIVSNFYFWFGYIGVCLFSFIFCSFINKLQQKNEKIFLIWKIYLITTVFRWYLYGAFDFCRGVLIVFPISYFVFYMIDLFTKKKY